MNIFEGFFTRKDIRRFSAWQIELTTRCSLKCTMCIKEEQKDYIKKDMSIDDFRKIIPYLKNVENVVLEGWGESLLYRDLTECIDLAKQQGTKVGFVTSGIGLTNEYAKKIFNSGIDFIGFSLSGAKPETHNSIRVNSDFDAVINTIKYFKKLSRKHSLSRVPRIHIVYLMLKENIHELSALIDIAKEIGIEEIILLNIIQISNLSQDNKKVFGQSSEDSYKDLVNKALNKARRSHVKLALPGLMPKEAPICSENPLKNLYISVEGEVSPCVFLCPPVPSPFKRIFLGKEHLVNRVSFGNIFRESFASIWNSEGYLNFRSCFIRRQEKHREIYRNLLELKKNENMELPPPPLSCQTCHKILGL